ncbi:ABC transporter substrate-binding protein [Rhizomicrobium electricum]|jgi:phospholipid transport system substrate-binding protein|uniref:ABC transporter substrate-binding protein n=1 Tax=Rhizomicrobium electricum TaxID=480070 RepID=A0ABN1FB44_9PROT|nr:ABC transporter substrate-binding protein [Rhizomicrobium electricum]NIJ50564.1 phospholipid transport system substrate-binding protein [Rhizomicrobium electricum]
MMKGWFRAAAMTTALLTAGVVAHAEDAAVAPVQSFYDGLLSTMKQGKSLGIKGRFEKLKPVIEASFDMPGMTRLSVGPAWNTMSDADHAALTKALTRYTVASYASNFKSFDGEKFVVEPAAKDRNADKVVFSKLIAGNETIPFNYLMRKNGASWKVIDIYLNGFVSQMAKQRSDFSSTVTAGGAAALEKKINTLADGMMKD